MLSNPNAVLAAMDATSISSSPPNGLDLETTPVAAPSSRAAATSSTKGESKPTVPKGGRGGRGAFSAAPVSAPKPAANEAKK